MYSGMAKGTSRAVATSNSKNQAWPVALAIVELRLSEGISGSVQNSIKCKFQSNFLKVFQVYLKACLGLVLPNQHCHQKL